MIRQLDELREATGLSKADLARRIGRDPSSIRRLFTAESNPELLLVASIAEDLGADVRIVPRSSKESPSLKPRRDARVTGSPSVHTTLSFGDAWSHGSLVFRIRRKAAA